MPAKRLSVEQQRRQETALRVVRLAGATATGPVSSSDRMAAELDVRQAVDAARELGVEWGEIAAVLGIARGNAYRKYRRTAAPRPRLDAPAL